MPRHDFDHVLVARNRIQGTNFLDVYEIVDDFIGEGSFATIKKVRHKMTGKRAAVKVFEAPKTEDEISDIISEGKLMIDLKNPSIVRVYQVFTPTP